MGILQRNLRDFHDELKDTLEIQYPGFKACELDMWRDNLCDLPNTATFLDAADGQLDKLELTKNKALFEADSLALARDAAQCANLYQRTLQTDRAARLAKVMHLKQENSIGGSLVSTHMKKNCHHVAGPMTVLQPALDQECPIPTHQKLAKTPGENILN